MSNLFSFDLETNRTGFFDITDKVIDFVKKSGVKEGICLVYCPHTTASITINENADPDVVSDLLLALDRTYPDRPEFRHSEGNSAAHLKASVIGSSVTVMIDDGNLVLGRWQGIYFTEFDGPRQRRFSVKIIGTQNR